MILVMIGNHMRLASRPETPQAGEAGTSGHGRALRTQSRVIYWRCEWPCPGVTRICPPLPGSDHETSRGCLPALQTGCMPRVPYRWCKPSHRLLEQICMGVPPPSPGSGQQAPGLKQFIIMEPATNDTLFLQVDTYRNLSQYRRAPDILEYARFFLLRAPAWRCRAADGLAQNR